MPSAEKIEQVRLGRTSGHVFVLVVLGGLVVLSALLSLRVGTLGVSWHDAIAALTSYRNDSAASGQTAVRVFRLPRTIVGVGVGMALGVTGALMQGLTRNPLADSGLLGINAGAAFAVSWAILQGVNSIGSYVWFAFIGAAVAGGLVYMLGSIGGSATPVKLTLAGAMVASMIGASTATLRIISPDVFDIFRFWVAGSVAGVELSNFFAVAPFLGIGLLISMGLGGALNGIALGDDVARALGHRVVAIRFAVALSVVLLAGPAVAVAGPIAFVGLVVPHLARFLFGPDYRWILPASALIGASFLLLVDVAGRFILSPAEVHVGVMTALVGAPFLIYVGRKRSVERL